MNTIYTVKDVAYLLGVDDETVRRWIRTGELECCEIPINRGCGDNGYRITASMVERFMERHQSGHAASKLESCMLRREIQDRLDTLDEYEDRLYQERCFLEGMKNFIEEMGL